MNLICEKATMLKPISRCTYCNSVSYGKGCRYAPGGVHHHGGDPKKCVYCGSLNFGRGCRLNPFDNLHVHGIPYNSMMTEQITEKLRKAHFLKELTKSITEYKAYELGIIDECGNKIQEPKTEEERSAYTPLTQVMLRVKRYLGGKLDLIASTELYEEFLHVKYDRAHHEKILNFESKLKGKINEIFEIIEEASKEGITFEEIDEFLQK